MKFKGYDWSIRDTAGHKEGPGNNIFSKYNVLLEDQVTLQVNDKSSEIYIDKPLGYGVYEFKIECPIFLPKGIVLGVFLYKDDQEEADIELSRWNKIFSKNAQFVIQRTKEIVRFFNLTRNNHMRIEFYKQGMIFDLNGKRWQTKSTISEKAKIHINLWKYGNQANAEIKLIDFKFKPW